MSEASYSLVYVGDLLSFDSRPAPRSVHPGFRPGPRLGLRRGTSATSWYDTGCRLETTDRRAAIAAYERAIEVDVDAADANFNLARLLELKARRIGDVAMLQRAVRHLLRYRELTRRNARAR